MSKTKTKSSTKQKREKLMALPLMASRHPHALATWLTGMANIDFLIEERLRSGSWYEGTDGKTLCLIPADDNDGPDFYNHMENRWGNSDYNQAWVAPLVRKFPGLIKTGVL